MLQLGRAPGQPEATILFTAWQYAIRYERGRLSEMEAAVGDLAAACPESPASRRCWRSSTARPTRGDRARLVLDRLAEGGFTGLTPDSTWLTNATLCAEVANQGGDVTSAAVLYDLPSPYRGQLAFSAGVSLGSIDHSLAVLATVLGRLEAADTHFTEAVATYERIGAATWLARARLGWAPMLRRRARAGRRPAGPTAPHPGAGHRPGPPPRQRRTATSHAPVIAVGAAPATGHRQRRGVARVPGLGPGWEGRCLAFTAGPSTKTGGVPSFSYVGHTSRGRAAPRGVVRVNGAASRAGRGGGGGAATPAGWWGRPRRSASGHRRPGGGSQERG